MNRKWNKTRWPHVRVLLICLLIIVGYPLFISPHFFNQTQAAQKVITSGVDFSAGTFNGTESQSKEGELKLKPDGIWNARVWRTPSLVLGDGTAITSDSTHTYMMIGRDTRFSKYVASEDKWKTLATSPHMPYSGSDMIVLNNNIYAIFGGYQLAFSKYSIANNTWSDLANTPDLVFSGSSIQTDGTYIYVMRGASTTDFWRYNPSTNSWTTLTAPPATISSGADLIFDNSTGTSYLYTPRGASTTTFYRYDIAANTWSTMAVVPGTLNDNGNITKANGYIYILRGTTTQTFYRYNISANTWSTLTNTPVATRYVGLTYNQAEDLIYVFRGNGAYDWWKYDPDTTAFKGNADLPATPGTGADVIYSSNVLYFRRGNNSTSFYKYTIATDTWTTMAVAPATFNDDTKGVKAGNYLYFFRGSNTTSFYRYDIGGDSWSTMAVAPATVNSGASLAYPGSGDYIYATRGGITSSVWRYSISGDSWSDAGAADLPTGSETGVGGRLISDGTNVFAITGSGIANILKYTVATDTWTLLGNVPFAPYYGTDMVFYNGKIYAEAGSYKTSFWEYTISSGQWRRLADMAGYYADSIGSYNGGSIAADTSNGVLYSINGMNLTRLLSFTPSAANYPTSGTWTSDPIDLTYVSSWTSLSASVSAPGDSTISYESRSSADKSTWTSWASVSGGSISSTAQRYLELRATLNATSDQTSTPVLSSITINYSGDTAAPTNPSTFTGSSQAVGGVSLTTGSSYPYSNPYFSWNAGTDSESSVSGYYMYFGTNSSADPESSGVFQTTRTYTVTTPMSTGIYYLRVKTKDASGNISAASTAFTYVYNGVTPPQTAGSSTTVDFSGGTATNIDTSGDQLKLNSSTGFWQQKRLTTIPAAVSYGSSFAYVSTSNKLYTFRGNNTTTFYEYDVASDTWTSKAVAPAAVYQGGDIVEGPSGYLYATPGRILNSFWRYDIAADTWSDAAAADAPLSFYYGSSFMYDGSHYIYVLRGNSDDAFMRYDTSSDTWEILANTDFGAPSQHLNNNVYVGGDLAYDGSSTLYAIQGNTYSGFSSYSIDGNSWTTLPDLPALPNDGAQIVYDSSTNAIYYIPGWSNPFLYKYDISAGSWSELTEAPAAISAGGAMRNINGVLYILRGGGTTTFWTYNISKSSWELPNTGFFGPEYRGSNYRPFGYGANIVKGDGNYYYLVRGNFDNVFSRYNASTGEITYLADSPAGFYIGTAMTYDSVNNKIYSIPSQYVRELDSYDIATDAWTTISADTPPAAPAAGSSLTFDGSRYIYWLRGGSTSFYRYDTQASSGSRWSTLTSIPAAVASGSEIIYKSGYVYATRGNNTLTFYRYDVGANTWSDAAVADLPSGGTISTDGFLVDMGTSLIACRGANLVGCYQYSISGNTWSAIPNAPANINQGGAAASNGSNRMYVIGANGTNTYSNGLYSYIMQTSSTSFTSSGDYVSPVHDLSSVYKFANISVGYTAADNTTLTVYSQTSSDNSTYSSWTEASELKVVGSSYTYKINSPINRYLKLKFAFTSTDGIYSPVVSDYTLNYYQDTTVPINPSSINSYNGVSASVPLTTNTWYNYSAPYFDWPDAEAANGATDSGNGSGVAGYYVYFGTNASADPVSLGTLTTETNYTASSLVTGSTYYLRIKTKDDAENVSSTVWQPFIYKYDTDIPTNPTTIVANPPGYSATDSFTFSWSGGEDEGSEIAAYCYKTGADDATETCTIEDSVSGIPSYKTGTNTFYLRTKDTAGNYSSGYSTVSYYYSATAPSAPKNVVATPTSNTVNQFSFTWEPPDIYYGTQSDLRYYYSVNALPTSSNVNTVGLATAYLTTGAFATQNGANIFYVVAKDSAGNIDYNNYATVSFTADTSSPGIPQNMDIADVSVKETESWKLALSWEPPSTSGSGISVYKVYSSTTADASCTDGFSNFTYISSTTGKSYVDTDLTQEKHYYCVKACTSTNDCSAPSDTVSMLPDGKWRVAPDAVASPSATVKTRSASVAWTTNRKANSFVKYGKSSGDYGDEVGSSEQETSHVISLTSLDPGTTYYYKALWTDEDGNSGSSSEYSFTTNEAPFVSSVKITNVSIHEAYVTFTEKNATTASLEFGKTTAYGGTQTISTSKTESTYTVQLTELTEGTVYHLRLVAEDEEGNTYNGDDYTFQTLPVPKIQNLKIQQVEGMATATLRLLWSSNTRLTTVVTYYPTSKPELSKDFINLTPQKNHEVILKDLIDETEYSIIVKGKDSAANEALSDPKTVKTASDLRPPQVENISVESTIIGVGQDARAQVSVSWDTDEPSSSQVEYGEGTGTTYTSTTSEDTTLTSNHNVIIPGLVPSKIYHLRINSKDKNKNNGVSPDTVVITPNATKDALNLVIQKLSKTFGFLKTTKLK